jgi:hypothetical protein
VPVQHQVDGAAWLGVLVDSILQRYRQLRPKVFIWKRKLGYADRGHMLEYDEVAYSMNILSPFLVTYRASCEFVNAFYAITNSNGQNMHMGQVFNHFCLLGVSGKLLKLCFLFFFKNNLDLSAKNSILLFLQFFLSLGAVNLQEVAQCK